MKLPLGFAFEETMAGTWSRASGAAGGPNGERPVAFTVRARAADLAEWLRTGQVGLDGTIEVSGLASHVPARGTMVLAPLRRRIIRYELAFTGDDARPYRLEGQKDLSLADLPGSLTVLPAVIVHGDSGTEVGRATLRFDAKADLVEFLLSWRPVLG